MKNFRLFNNLLGWLVFFISLIVYFLTLEPTVSLWDCGEFIASSYKLQIGHPPGAPFFMVIARFASLFAGGNTEKVALMVNGMSATASAFTVMFLFWSITHLALKLLYVGNRGLQNSIHANTNQIAASLSPAKLIAVLGSGLVGSLAYTFTDTFWFSAVEGEVYASSSFFTAVVFWAILKWENEADEFFCDHPKIEVIYEHLSQNTDVEIQKIQKFLNLSKVPVKAQTHKQIQQPLSQIIENYEDLKSRFNNTEWAAFFED